MPRTKIQKMTDNAKNLQNDTARYDEDGNLKFHITHGDGHVELYIDQFDGESFIVDLFVPEESRRQGIGGKLLKIAMAAADGLGLVPIYLKVQRRSWMREWYERKGFRYYCTDEDNYVWMVYGVDSL